MNIKRGKLITFEGPEGGGKSTQAAALAQALRNAGHAVEQTREPGGTWLGEGVRGLLKDHRQPAPVTVAELFLFLAARAQLVGEVIVPALAAGKHVICDRFADSTVVYQGFGRDMGVERMMELNALATGGLAPDITFLLDLEAAAGLQRARRRQDTAGGAPDRIECEAPAFHERVRDGYLELARREPARFYLLDAARPPGELRKKIWDVIQRVIQS